MKKMISLLLCVVFTSSTLYANNLGEKAYKKAELISKNMKNSNNIGKTSNEAKEQYVLSCKNGYDKGCNQITNMGIVYLSLNPIEAKDLLKVACDGNNAKACGILSDIYFQGIEDNIKKDTKLAIKLLKKSSNLGYKASQLVMAGKLISGKGFSKNIKAGKKILETLCNKNYNNACITLAKYKYAGIKGIKKDKKGALNILTKSCKNKSGEACFQKSMIRLDKIKNSNITPKVKVLNDIINDLQKSCKLGFKPACKNKLKKMKIKG